MNLHRAFLLYHAPHLPQNRSTPIGSHQRSREKKLSIKRHSKPMKIQTPRIQRRAETKAHGRLVLASLCQITPDKPPIEAAWSGHRTFTCPLSRQQNWCWIDSATAYHTRVIDNPPPRDELRILETRGTGRARTHVESSGSWEGLVETFS